MQPRDQQHADRQASQKCDHAGHPSRGFESQVLGASAARKLAGQTLCTASS